MWTFLTILFALICLFMAVFPRGYWLLQASGYKNPEAHEPSDGTVTFTRVLGIVTLVVLVFIFIPAAIEHDQKPAETTTYQQTREEPEPTPEQTCEKGTFLCLED